METKLNESINSKLMDLVEFIVKKNPNVDKGLINHKINQLFKPVAQLRVNQTKSTIKSKLSSKHNILNNIQKKVIKVVKSPFSNYVLIVDNSDDKNIDLQKNKFVMDISSKIIIGIENLNGEIEPLNKSLIEICHKYKLKYVVPLNLNISDEPDQDSVIVNEIHDLGLNYAESDEEVDANED